ncbi:MAG: enoyl-CoA hydratase/isomerase family protein, partial [Sciscionella sp.]
MAEFVALEVADGVGTIRLDRAPVNALNQQMQAELRDTAREAADRADIRSVIVYGGAKAFAAGVDIKEMASMSYAEMAARAHGLSACFSAVAQIPKPTVAAITGPALACNCCVT